ncbi:MAG: hypothetical protein HN981_01725 [Candidatus Pacebacteria bacterium]|jgi:hypothetical protein|nr:hypothetical protein [Candidatus Paceibacterota bacterium]MBT4652724.1 hypothetical protein [Candidatus Paceibacterota bacterium]MBT6755881.1 hypothetical protein [Candidatus Paceibacterota bacterium]MBT6921094.1 hypothetical protein [Candidatus Paceibacterota bacterium]
MVDNWGSRNTINVGNVGTITQGGGKDGNKTTIDGVEIGAPGSSKEISVRSVEWTGLNGETKEVKAGHVTISESTGCTFKIVGCKDIYIAKSKDCQIDVYDDDPEEPIIHNTCENVTVKYFTLAEETPE